MPKRGVINVQIIFAGIPNAVKPLFNSPFEEGEPKPPFSREVARRAGGF